MKKLSKVLSFILGASMTIGIAGAMNAEAISQTNKVDPLATPEGCVLYDLNCETGETIYRSITGSGMAIEYIDSYYYNDLKIELEDGVDKYETVQKYLSDLNFSICNYYDKEYEVNRPDLKSKIRLYDKYVSGDDPRTHESVEDKYKPLSEICAQMYEDGVIKSAILTPSYASGAPGNFKHCIYISKLYAEKKEDLQPYADKIQELVSKYTEYCKVNIFEYNSAWGFDDMYYIYVNLVNSEYNTATDIYSDFNTYDKLTALRDEIAGLDGFDNMDVNIDRVTYEVALFIYAPEVNLLDPYICDIDGSGEADIADATTILQSYAESAAGLQKAAANDKMDVNGDGEVNIEDATYVLTYYAEAAAGIR